ncbi:hypothetical protein [Thermodesulfatator indicus]
MSSSKVSKISRPATGPTILAKNSSNFSILSKSIVLLFVSFLDKISTSINPALKSLFIDLSIPFKGIFPKIISFIGVPLIISP